ncbi:MAG TPA: zinc-binding dehydrogenase [Gaiellales bacterium]|nr:zinc-binding dehydrogenase [Gaiellales bacterium]
MARAAVCHRFGDPMTVEEVVLAPPGEGEVRVQLEACAICHSDVAYADGAWGGTVPTVLGHEACGLVAEAGPEVTALRPGQRVVVSLVRHCGACGRCADGEPALCEATFALDERSPIRFADGEPVAQGLRCGAFAEEVVVHASQAVPVPRHLPAASLSVLGCAVLTGMGAAERAGQVGPGQTVAVIGAGGVGLNAIQGAAIAGADAVIAIDVADEKLAAAEAFGATAGVNARSADPAAAGALAGGADVVIATAGSARAVEQGLALLRRGGTLVVVGMPASGEEARFDPTRLAHDGMRIVGTKMGSARPADDIPRLVALYEDGRLKLDELVTATYPLEAIGEAVAAMRRGEAVRNVIAF